MNTIATWFALGLLALFAWPLRKRIARVGWSGLKWIGHQPARPIRWARNRWLDWRIKRVSNKIECQQQALKQAGKDYKTYHEDLFLLSDTERVKKYGDTGTEDVPRPKEEDFVDVRLYDKLKLLERKRYSLTTLKRPSLKELIGTAPVPMLPLPRGNKWASRERLKEMAKILYPDKAPTELREKDWREAAKHAEITKGMIIDGSVTTEIVSVPVPNPKFKKDWWVRKPDGELGKIVSLRFLDCGALSGPEWQYRLELVTKMGNIYHADWEESSLQLALPKDGERWKRIKCPSGDHCHKPTEAVQIGSKNWVNELWLGVSRNGETVVGSLEERIECGCLVPVNFGMGEKPEPESKPKSKPDPKFTIGQWVRITKGGHSGELGTISKPCDTCGNSWCVKTLSYLENPQCNHEDGLEPAYPKIGEWWIDQQCEHHSLHTPTKAFQIQPGEGYYHGIMAGEDWPHQKGWIDCGCRFPVNFGKGNNEEKDDLPF